MKRLLKILLTAVIMIIGVNQAAAQSGGYFLIKSNINANMGFDLGIDLKTRSLPFDRCTKFITPLFNALTT